MDIVTLGAALNGSAEYVNSHFKGGSNIQIVDNPDGTQTINASGEVSAEDTVARADIAAIKDGETLDSFGDVETALDTKANTSTTYTKTEVDTALSAKADKSTTYTKTEVDTALDDKVDKETGKGLSTNDYTTAEKTKLAGIAEGAEVNKIEGIKVNNTSVNPDANKVVNITVPTTAADVSALPDTTKYAAALSLTINSSTFVMTGQLKDQNGDNLGTAQTIDLPLESVVVGGSYNSQTKKVVLTLQNGNTIEFSVADLVSGLQTELSASNKLNPAYINYDSTHRAVSDTEKSTWNGKQSALTTEQLAAVNSGITEDNVAQIETNKNNISLIEERNPMYQLIQPNGLPRTYNPTGATVTVNTDNSVTVNATDTHGVLSYDIGTVSLKANTSYVCTGAPSGSSNSTYFINIDFGGSNVNVSSDYTFTPDSDTTATIKVYVRPNIVCDKTFYPMIVEKSLYDAGFTDYQPYALSNAAITPALKECVDNEKKNYLYYTLDILKVLNRDGTWTGNAFTHTKGVTFRVNSDMSISVSGTNNSSSDCVFLLMSTGYAGDIRTIPTGTYIASGCPTGGSDSTYVFYFWKGKTTSPLASYSEYGNSTSVYLDYTNASTERPNIAFIVKTNNTVNFTVYPMICKPDVWAVSHKYAPYAMSNAELTAEEQANENNILWNTQSGVKNLFNLTKVSGTYNTVVFTVNSDKTITVSGTASPSNSIFNLDDWTCTKAGAYVVSGTPLGGSWFPSPNTYRMRVAVNGTWKGDDVGNGFVLTLAVGDVINLQINTSTEYTVNNLVFKPMICPKSLYDADPSYQPYAMSNAELTAKEQANESNISSAANVGVKNLCKPNVSADSEVTYTVNADNSITVTCNTTAIRDVRIFTDLSGLTDGKDYILSGCSGGDYNNTYGFAIRTSSSAGKAFESNGETTFTKTAEMVKMDLIIRAGQNWTKTFYPMIRPAYISDPTYQPYAMSNAELTAAIQALQAQLANQ